MVAVDFKTLYEVWEGLNPGDLKDTLRDTLRTSPLYAVMESNRLLQRPPPSGDNREIIANSAMCNGPLQNSALGVAMAPVEISGSKEPEPETEYLTCQDSPLDIEYHTPKGNEIDLRMFVTEFAGTDEPSEDGDGGTEQEVRVEAEVIEEEEDLGYPLDFEDHGNGQIEDEVAAIQAEIELQDQQDVIESAQVEEMEMLEVNTALEVANEAPTAQQEPPQVPPVRRSARLSEKSPIKTYSVKRKKTSKEMQVDQPSIKEKLQDSDLLKEMDAEILKASPLEEEKAMQVHKACGMMGGPNNNLEIEQGVEQGCTRAQTEAIKEERNEGEEGNESVLAAMEFDSEDELTDEDAE